MRIAAVEVSCLGPDKSLRPWCDAELKTLAPCIDTVENAKQLTYFKRFFAFWWLLSSDGSTGRTAAWKADWLESGQALRRLNICPNAHTARSFGQEAAKTKYLVALSSVLRSAGIRVQLPLLIKEKVN